MPEKEPKIEPQPKQEVKKISEKKLTDDVRDLLEKKRKSPDLELSEEDEAKLADIQRFLQGEETEEEVSKFESSTAFANEEVQEPVKQPWYKRAWQKWVNLNQGIDAETDKMMRAFNYQEPRDTIWDKSKRKKSLKQMKERGFEAFEDFHLHDIVINSIEKKSYGEQLDTFAKGLDRKYFDFYGREQQERAEIEVIKGDLIIEGPLFGDNPIDMEWKAFVFQTKAEADSREYSIDLYWHENFKSIASAADTDLEVPSSVVEQGKKMGLDVSVPVHIPQYNVYYKPHSGAQDPSDRIPIYKDTRMYKAFYIKTTQKVFEQLRKYIKQACSPDEALNPEYVNSKFNVSTEISQEIDKERENQIVKGLESRQFDEKIFYLGEGAAKFLQILQSEEYKLANTELELIQTNIEELAEFINGKTIYDLGAANALKALPLLEKQLKSADSVDYVPVDINPSLIFAAAANIDNPQVNVTGKVLDFTKPLVGKLEDRPKTITLLGSTLGNGDIAWQQSLLQNISQAMTDQDSLLVGISLKTDLQKTLAMYDNPQGREFVMTTVKNLGFLEDKVELEVVADEATRQIKQIIHIKEDLIIKRGEQEISYKKGEQITIFVSQKYEVGELEKLADQAGLVIEKLFTDKDQQVELAALRKK
ncbi:L-histidine N(alpha)-methyltransferase [Patescibacteria group bacterium]